MHFLVPFMLFSLNERCTGTLRPLDGENNPCIILSRQLSLQSSSSNLGAK